MFVPTTTPKVVAIVGLGPTKQFYNEEVDACGDRKKLFHETWTFNSYASVIESDMLFHMDDVLVQDIRVANGNVRVANMLEAMKRYKGPIFSSFPDERFPTMKQFPIAEIAGFYNSLYFTTTPTYAMAMAGFIGVEKLYIYGCDYTWPGIAGAESGRAGMEYWVGRLTGMGVKIFIHPESSLCDARLNRKEKFHLYGYDRVDCSLREHEDGSMQLVMREKNLPTAEEIEERYSHYVEGSSIQVDVVN